jgi:hypothetical protein
MTMPLIGAIFAAILFKLNVYFDNKALQQVERPVAAPAPVAVAGAAPQ